MTKSYCHNPATISHALSLYREGMSARDVSKSLDVSRSTLHFWLMKNKIPIHPRGGWTINEEGRRHMAASRRRGPAHWNWKGGLPKKKCAECGNVFLKAHDRKHPKLGKYFCSMACAQLHQIENRHPCWKGGHPTHRGGRYTIWARLVLEAHGHKCKRCGSKMNVEAHHIRPWAKFPDFRYDVSNGIPLCDPCHVNVHREKKRPWLILSA